MNKILQSIKELHAENPTASETSMAQKIHHKIKSTDELSNELYQLTDFLPPAANQIQRMWHIKNNIFEIPICKKCGDPVMWSGRRYKIFCSTECQNVYGKSQIGKDWWESLPESEKIDRRKQLKINIENKYGDVKNVSYVPEIIEKRQRTREQNFIASPNGQKILKFLYVNNYEIINYKNDIFTLKCPCCQKEFDCRKTLLLCEAGQFI